MMVRFIAAAAAIAAVCIALRKEIADIGQDILGEFMKKKDDREKQ